MAQALIRSPFRYAIIGAASVVLTALFPITALLVA